jgi:hypothetical protein
MRDGIVCRRIDVRPHARLPHRFAPASAAAVNAVPTEPKMGLLSKIANRWKREPTRAEVEDYLERRCPGSSELDKLGELLRWIFETSPESYDTLIARARHRGIRLDRAVKLLGGDVRFGFRWDLIEDMLKEARAPSAAVDVACDLFHDFSRVATRPPGPESHLGSSVARRLDHRQAAEETATRVARTRPPHTMWTGQHGIVFRTDVVGFSAHPRTDQDAKIIREVMYTIVRAAFDAIEISLDDCNYGDRGDGILAVIPPTVPTKRVIHPLLAHLASELSRHNARAEDGTRFQLRVALDVGPVESDAEGLTGQVINRTARLVDAPALKKRLKEAGFGTCVGFIASDAVYDDVIKQHPGQMDPASYQKVSWLAKGRRFTGWIKLSPDDAPDELARP